jgi:linoleoyl-CoA desaturase
MGGTTCRRGVSTGTTQCITLHQYPRTHEDLDAGRIIRFTKEAKWHNRFQQYYSVFHMAYLLNWAITTDFKQMKSYLKRKLSYVEAKSPKHF